MQSFENAHYDSHDAQLDWLDPSISGTEAVADRAAEDLNKFPDDLAESARADLQEARAEAVQWVKDQKESTQASVLEAKSNNLDRQLVLSINEKFANIPLEQRQLFERAIIDSGNNNPEYISMLQEEIDNNPDDILDYFEEAWVPDRKTIAFFNEEFELLNIIEKGAENLTEYQKKHTSLLLSLNVISDHQVAQELINMLNVAGWLDLTNIYGLKTSGKKIVKYLWSWDGSNLWKLLASVEKNSPEYNALTASLVLFDSSFEDKIKEFESPISNDWLRPWDWIEDHNDGNLDVRTYISADGSKTGIDASVFPPKREISLSGSDYRLETETPMTKDIQAISTKYELAHNELWPKINSVSKLIKIMETIWNSTVLKLEDVKNTLINKVLTYSFRAQNPDIVNAIESADSMMSLSNLATTWVIAQLKQKWQDDLDAAEREYKNDLADQVDSYRDMMAQKDIQTKKTLKVLKNTGFDLLPQSITDQLIAEIESGQLILDLGTSFDPKNVDLANGDFWEPKTLENSDDHFVKNLVRFMNKLIGLKPDGTDSDGNLVWLSEEVYLIGNAPHTPEEIRNMIMEAGVISEAGWFNLDRARNNLKRPLSELEADIPEPVVEENTDELTS